MSSLGDLDTALANVLADLDTLKGALDAIVAKLGSSPVAPDVASEVATVQEIASRIEGLSSEATDAVTPPPPAAPAEPPAAPAADTPAVAAEPAPAAPPQEEGVNVFPAGTVHVEPSADTAAENPSESSAASSEPSGSEPPPTGQ